MKFHCDSIQQFTAPKRDGANERNMPDHIANAALCLDYGSPGAHIRKSSIVGLNGLGVKPKSWTAGV
jgi:hypothetical protein